MVGYMYMYVTGDIEVLSVIRGIESHLTLGSCRLESRDASCTFSLIEVRVKVARKA